MRRGRDAIIVVAGAWVGAALLILFASPSRGAEVSAQLPSDQEIGGPIEPDAADEKT